MPFKKKQVIECLFCAQPYARVGETVANDVDKVLMEFAGLMERTMIKKVLTMLGNTCFGIET